MQKNIEIKNKKINYILRRRRRSRSVRLAIYPDGAFVVTAPKWYPLYIINNFIREKSEWILDRIKNVDSEKSRLEKEERKNLYKKAKTNALAIIRNRIEFFNQYYGFEYGRVSIKDQKSCWGSCSAKGNLNFSWRVAFLPAELRDYVIIHELCHLRELNHSQNFWKLVSSACPRHKELRKKLKHLPAGRQEK